MTTLNIFIKSKCNPKGLILFVLVIVLFACSACQAPAVVNTDLLDLDYYFGDSWLQIQGISTLPRIKKRINSEENSEFEQYQFLTLTQRRNLCHQSALQNAHTKFLSISEKQWLPQSEWKLRLKLGANGHWRGCLEESRVMETFYDLPNRCRLVVWYDCDPRDF